MAPLCRNLAVGTLRALDVLAKCMWMVPLWAWPPRPRAWPMALVCVAGLPVLLVEVMWIVEQHVIHGKVGCVFLYCGRHRLPRRGWALVLATTLSVPAFLTLVGFLLSHEFAGGVPGVNWFMTAYLRPSVDLYVGVHLAVVYALTLLPMTTLGALTADLRADCISLAAESRGREGCAEVQWTQVHQLLPQPGVTSREECLQLRWRSLRVRFQLLLDLARAAHASLQWHVLITVGTTFLYAALQLSDCLAKTYAGSITAVRQVSQLLDVAAHVGYFLVLCCECQAVLLQVGAERK
ncbi:hypothetical protein ONE63_001100 [Megalurothrips usitatus]|uniref:Gustatory receptor n=1 Tax=Megalurothrips usitatus TaxID=439358 RepID=A0AAV7XFF4_9NEOP|nr:hypothetical protein ONE63_001100 [Megalurothrips usitatus]